MRAAKAQVRQAGAHLTIDRLEAGSSVADVR